MNPPRVNFGQISRRRPPTPRTIELRRGDGGPLDLQLQAINQEGVRAELREKVPGEVYELEVSLVEPYPASQLRSNLTLDTGVKEMPALAIPVYGAVQPRVSANPNRFTISASGTTAMAQTVRVTWDTDDMPDIVKAEIDDPALTVETSVQDGQQLITLKVPQDFDAQGRQRAVTVTFADEETSALRIPVYFRSRATQRTPGRAFAPRESAKTTVAPAAKVPAQDGKPAEGGDAETKPAPASPRPAPATRPDDE